jgi:hypothetical protein
MLDRAKSRLSNTRNDAPVYLQRAWARHEDRAAKLRLQKALARKAETVAELKRLKMKLEG